MLNIVLYAFTFADLAFAGWLARRVRLDTRAVCLAGMMIAATLALSMLRVPLPTGGSLALLSVLPLMLLSALFGPALGVAAGAAAAVLAMLLLPDWALVHPMQFFVEHLVCMTSLGYTGLFGAKSRARLLAGAVLAAAVNLLGHIFSGVLFFGAYAPAGMGVWKYSVIYNVGSQGTENLAAVILLLLLPLAGLQKAVRRQTA